jgi:hypothetical protein
VNVKRAIVGIITALSLTAALAAHPTWAQAQQAGSSDEDAVYWAGSFILSLLHLPVKFVTCVGTQATAAVAYVATYRVEGNYWGGTNGREIGEIARRSCTGPWVVTFDDVKSDYGP